MHRIGVQARMPEHRDGEFRQGNRQRKTVHARPQVFGVAFRNGSDQIGGSGKRQRGRETGNDGHDLPFQLQRRQHFIDRPLVEPAP
ncbi:hypothetical protein D3C84_543680 [compost metagenome]